MFSISLFNFIYLFILLPTVFLSCCQNNFRYQHRVKAIECLRSSRKGLFYLCLSEENSPPKTKRKNLSLNRFLSFL